MHTTSPTRQGARDIVPMAIGVFPFALALGATIAASTAPTAVALASGPLILAGAAQLTTLQMLEAGVAPIVIVASALMINARLLLYSAGSAPWFRAEPFHRRLLLAVPVIDQLYLTAIPRFEKGDLDAAGRRAYWIGASAVLVGVWTVAQAAAAVAGAALPDGAGLDVAAPLALAGLLARSTTTASRSISAAAAAAVAVVGVGLPYRSAVFVAALAGTVVGVVIERRTT